jgi:hypothetical protein
MDDMLRKKELELNSIGDELTKKDVDSAELLKKAL